MFCMLCSNCPDCRKPGLCGKHRHPVSAAVWVTAQERFQENHAYACVNVQSCTFVCLCKCVIVISLLFSTLDQLSACMSKKPRLATYMRAAHADSQLNAILSIACTC